MRCRFLLPLVAVLVIAVAGCEQPNITPPGTAPVRYRDPIFDAVTLTKQARTPWPHLPASTNTMLSLVLIVSTRRRKVVERSPAFSIRALNSALDDRTCGPGIGWLPGRASAAALTTGIPRTAAATVAIARFRVRFAISFLLANGGGKRR